MTNRELSNPFLAITYAKGQQVARIMALAARGKRWASAYRADLESMTLEELRSELNKIENNL